MIRAISHVVIATDGVAKITRWFESIFSIKPHFENQMFSEFVTPSRFRIAFFKPVGESAKNFDASSSRKSSTFGVTVTDVDALYQQIYRRNDVVLSGPPKDHPWGEKSFLLEDPDGNRWEVTQSPSENGMLVQKD